MTLAELARQLNTTTMTIYRRLQKRGVTIKELRDADTGEITPAGASIIASMFSVTGTTQAEQAAAQTITGAVERNATGITGGDAATVAVLRAQLEGRDAIIAQLRDERDELRRQLATVTAALEREQADRSNERLLLTAGGSEQRRGLFGWLRRK